MAEKVSFVDAIIWLMDAVAFHKAEDLVIPQAHEMMAFAAKVLGVACPPELPVICCDWDKAFIRTSLLDAGAALGHFGR